MDTHIPPSMDSERVDSESAVSWNQANISAHIRRELEIDDGTRSGGRSRTTARFASGSFNSAAGRSLTSPGTTAAERRTSRPSTTPGAPTPSRCLRRWSTRPCSSRRLPSGRRAWRRAPDPQGDRRRRAPGGGNRRLRARGDARRPDDARGPRRRRRLPRPGGGKRAAPRRVADGGRVRDREGPLPATRGVLARRRVSRRVHAGRGDRLPVRVRRRLRRRRRNLAPRRRAEPNARRMRRVRRPHYA